AIANRFDTRETMVSRANGLLAEIPFAELENRQGSPTSRLSSDGGRNERSAVHPQAEQVGTAAPAPGQKNRKADSVINAVSHGVAVSPVYWARHLPQANRSQHDEHEDADLPESSNARPLLHLVSAATHAGAIGLVVPLEVALLLRLRLLVCRRRISVRASLAHEACRRSNASSDRRALAGIPTDGAADGAEGCASGTAPDRSALLRRRRGDLHGLRRIEAGLALRPVVALELILLELVLALTLLGVHEHFGTHRAGEHQQCQYRADGHQSLHVSPPWKTVTAPTGRAWPARR